MNSDQIRVESDFARLLMDRTPAQRLAMACGMFATAKSLACAGILATHGTLTPDALREHLFIRFYGQEFGEAERASIFDSWKMAEQHTAGIGQSAHGAIPDSADGSS